MSHLNQVEKLACSRPSDSFADKVGGPAAGWSTVAADLLGRVELDNIGWSAVALIVCGCHQPFCACHRNGVASLGSISLIFKLRDTDETISQPDANDIWHEILKTTVKGEDLKRLGDDE